MQADVYPKNERERADSIDGSIGEGSPFHATSGYYAQGVDEGTAILPTGWQERLVAVRNENARGATGWCLEVHDRVVSKCVAGRDKDVRFAIAAARHKLVAKATLLERLEQTPMGDVERNLVRGRIERLPY